jgi:hypothetical protein
MKYIIFIIALFFSVNLFADESKKNQENKKPNKEQKQEGKRKKHHGPRKVHPNHPDHPKKENNK